LRWCNVVLKTMPTLLAVGGHASFDRQVSCRKTTHNKILCAFSRPGGQWPAGMPSWRPTYRPHRGQLGGQGRGQLGGQLSPRFLLVLLVPKLLFGNAPPRNSVSCENWWTALPRPGRGQPHARFPLVPKLLFGTTPVLGKWLQETACAVWRRSGIIVTQGTIELIEQGGESCSVAYSRGRGSKV